MDYVWIIIIILTILTAIVLLFLFRQEIFGFGPMSKDEALSRGYGYYDESITTSCMNSSGKCSELGVQTTVTNCIPNPTTGRGCIDSNGSQTYKSIITHSNCVPQCRASVLEIEGVSDCSNTEGEEYGCLTDPS